MTIPLERLIKIPKPLSEIKIMGKYPKNNKAEKMQICVNICYNLASIRDDKITIDNSDMDTDYDKKKLQNQSRRIFSQHHQRRKLNSC